MKLSVVRDEHLNPWDVGNYVGAIDHGVEITFCGRGSGVPWHDLKALYPQAKFMDYRQTWEVVEGRPDVIDVPDAHYWFSQDLVERVDNTVMVAWDNVPGKNTFNPEAMKALKSAGSHVARSMMAYGTLLWDGVPPSKIHLIPGAVDTEFFHPPKKDRQPAVLFVGRLVMEKGLTTLIQALKMSDYELWVAGDGPERDLMQRWASKAGVRTEWLGHLNRHELAAAYQDASVTVVPSVPKLDRDPNATWIEQFGQVIIESMASGTPVIGAASGAIPEVIANGGRVFNPGDFGALRGLINIMMSPAGLAYRTSARDHAEKFYSQQVVGGLIKEVYFRGVT